MRYTVIPSNEFERQYENLKFSGRTKIIKKLDAMIELLAENKALPASARNHKLHAGLSDLYECHVDRDWLLTYKIVKKKVNTDSCCHWHPRAIIWRLKMSSLARTGRLAGVTVTVK